MKLGGRRALTVMAALCFPLVYEALAFLRHQHADRRQVVWDNSFVQFQFFAAGSVLAFLLYGFGLYADHAAVTSLVFMSEFWPHKGPFHCLVVQDVVSLLITIALASASYQLRERRLIRLKEHFAVVRSGPESALRRS